MFYVHQLRGEQLCGRTSSVSLVVEGEGELFFFSFFLTGEVERNANMAGSVVYLRTNGKKLQAETVPQLLHYHNTRKQHLACCYSSNLKTDWQDLQVLSLSITWPPWPLHLPINFSQEKIPDFGGLFHGCYNPVLCVKRKLIFCQVVFESVEIDQKTKHERENVNSV